MEYEGEYLFGDKNGEGKEYDGNGKLKYEGAYINGERNGQGKKYYENGELEFDGEFLYLLYEISKSLFLKWFKCNPLVDYLSRHFREFLIHI